MVAIDFENQNHEKSISIMKLSNSGYLLDIDEFLKSFLIDSKLNLFCYPIGACLKKILREKEVNEFLLKYKDLDELEFVEKIFEYLNFGYSISNRDRKRIPATGRVIFVANQPIGSLDSLSLLRMIKEIRTDVKIQSNEILSNIPQIKNSILTMPKENVLTKVSSFNFEESIEALEKEMAVIIFPSSGVSKFQLNGIKDIYWQKGFLRLAKLTQSPIVPIHIQGRNSIFYYLLATIIKTPSTIILVNEMFKQANKEIRYRVGELIPFEEIKNNFQNYKEATNAIRSQVYAIGAQKKILPLARIKTMEVILSPTEVRSINQELKDSHLLKKINDNKYVFLFDCFLGSFVMREIGRLREIVFRQVNEGTGKKLDLDSFDLYYRHIILWDREELVIMGSYRIGEAFKIVPQKGISGLYSSTLFEYSESANIFFNHGLELGRSFMQAAYWGKRGLDYLWMGIGAYLYSNPNVRYLFGPVSISGATPKQAKDLIVGFYQSYFNYDVNNNYAKAIRPYICSPEVLEYIKKEYPENREEALKKLKSELQKLEVQIPPLYKLYTELCSFDGVRFLGFNIDPDFNNSIDGLIVLDLNYLKDSFRTRYINSAMQ